MLPENPKLWIFKCKIYRFFKDDIIALKNNNNNNNTIWAHSEGQMQPQEHQAANSQFWDCIAELGAAGLERITQTRFWTR